VEPKRKQLLSTTVNGAPVERLVDVRKTLADFLREDAGCTSVHLGCEHGVCGACTVLVDGLSVRSCLRLAMQAEGKQIITLDGVMKTELGKEIGRAFLENFAMQCGFCTAGFAVSLYQLFREADGGVGDEELRETLGGNICRCTGYIDILKAARQLQQTAPAAAALDQEK
jgi:aerobic-type carbon monoxide dehydrogenase small subunit (CoxS/CutS family)